MSIILVVVLGGLLIFMMWNSSRKRKAQQQEMATKLGPGAEVMTTFGVFGRVMSMDETENRVVIETTPGTQLAVHKQAVGKIVEAAPDTDFAGEFDVPDDASSLTGEGHVAEYGTYGEAVDAATEADRDDSDEGSDEYEDQDGQDGEYQDVVYEDESDESSDEDEDSEPAYDVRDGENESK